MAHYIVKIVVTTVLIVLISEIAKRSSLFGAVLASAPLVSVLSMIWLYVETKDATKVIDLSSGIFWLILPSLVLFIALPLLLRNGMNFYLSLGISIFLIISCYWIMLSILHRFGINL